MIKAFIQSVASLLMLGLAKCQISPLTPLNVTVTNTDLIQINLTSIFNFGGYSSNNVTCDTRQSPGSVFYYNNSIFTRSLPVNYTNEPEIVNFVTNTSLFIIFDNTNVMIQSVNLDAESFGGAIFTTVGMPGVTAVCTDVEYNKNLQRYYVVCMTDLNQTIDKYIYIYEIDANTGAKLNQFSVPQPVNQSVAHRTQISFVHMFSGRGVVTTYVLVYDQGKSSSYATNNKWALVLGGADSGNLYTIGYSDLSVLNFVAIYDLFGVRGGVLVTGRNVSTPLNTTFTMAHCNIIMQGQQPVFNCSKTTYPAPFGTYYGYIGVMNTGQYVEVNANVNTPTQDAIYICNFHGSWESGSFIDTSNCKISPTSNIPDDIYISTVEGNAHQVVIKYVFDDSTYAGYTVENFDLRVGWWDLDDSLAPHYVPIGKSLIRVNSQQFDIYRMVLPYFFSPAYGPQGLGQRQNQIRIDCIAPNNGSTVTNFINIYVLTSMLDNVYVNNNNLYPVLNAYPGSDVMVAIHPMDILGNDLRVVVNPPQPLQGLVTANVYDNKYLNMEFDLNKGSDAFTQIRFAGKYAVAIDIQSNIIFMNCQFHGANLHVICTETYIVPTAGSDIFLHHDIETAFNYLFVWGTDSTANVTWLWFYDGNQTVTTFNERGVADDCTVSTANDLGYLVCAFSQFGIVRGWNFTANNFASRQRLPDIFQFNSGREFFCPQHVEFDMDTSEMLEVFSYCPNQDQRILRYRYPPSQNRQTGEIQVLLVTTVPINFAYTNVHVCSMGTEFVIYSQLSGKGNLQSAAMYDDRNQWNFGILTDDLNVGPIQSFSCVRDAGAFSVYSIDGNQNSVITTYFGNNQWQANKRAFTTFRDTNLNMYKFFNTYEFMGNVIHVLTPPGGPMMQKAYAMSFIRATIVDLHFEYGVNTNFPYNLEIDFVNSKNRAQTNAQVTFSNSVMNATVSVNSKINGVPSGVVEIEKFITIKGPVSYAYISGTDSVQVIGRLSSLNKDYFPDRMHQFTFDWMYTVGTTTVALHRYHPGNTSIFTIFQSVESFTGLFQPADGVYRYHFANFNSSNCQNCIFIAMSTASLTNSSLDFIALNGNSRMGIGFSNDQISMSYDKIRVVNLYNPNSNNYGFMVAAHNRTDGALITFIVQVGPQGQITSSRGPVLSGIYDFSVVCPDNSPSIYLVTVSQGNRNNIDFHTFSRQSGQPQAFFPLSSLTNGQEPYQINELEARIHNATAFYIVMSTKSTFIYEIIVDSFYPVPTINKYNKLPGFDGWLVDGNKQHIMLMTESTVPGDNDIRVDFFQRLSSGGDGNTYWTQHLDTFRPVSMTTCPMGMSHVMLSTPFPVMPLSFQVLNPMKLNFTGDSTNYGKAVLNIIATPQGADSAVNVADIYIDNGGGDDKGKKGVSWWLILLLVAGLLIAAAIVYMIRYGGSKDQESFKESGQYQSLAPGAKRDDPL